MNKPPPPPPPKPRFRPPPRFTVDHGSSNGSGLPPLPPRPPVPPMVRQPLHSNWFNLSPKISLDPVLLTGKSIGILGTNGSGKSGTSRKLMEEHIRCGLENFPFTVCDIENEYATLKELGEIFIAGVPKENSDDIKIDITLSDTSEFYELGRKAFEKRLTIVLLLGDINDEHRKDYLKAYLDGIFEAANDPRKAHYYRVFVEEAQEYVAQGGGDKSNDELRKSIIRFAKRGRKRKLSLAIISQRPSNVDKNVLTQAHLFLLHFVTYATDINVYGSSLGVEKAAETVAAMSPGDCILIFGKVYIQDRITKPKTVSPWDEAANFDPARFIQAIGGEEIQETIHREAASRDEGTSIVSTSYIHGLERQTKEDAESIRLLVETQIRLEDEIAVWKTKKAPTSGNVDYDTLVAAYQELQERVNVFEAQALPVRLITDLIRQQK